jgi:fibro-slime domain-containing protein
MSSSGASRVLVLVLVLGACEGRTALRIVPCSQAGATQACSNTCGEGTQTCKGGSWSACVVAPVYSPCQDTCGDGTRLCQNNQWAATCNVAPVRVPCSNTCGDGTQLCENNQRKGACDVADVVKACSSICGAGTMTCTNNAWQACTAPQPKQAQQPKLIATIRDFHITFPDMNHDGISETGIVASTLGEDNKPVYAHSGSTATVVGPETFYQWYRDVPGTNWATTIDIPLSVASGKKGVYTYDNTSFFPIDDQSFGNEGQPHNYAFTAEIATQFRYQGGETFTFSGDDDVFVFINRKLAIDLGGIHSMLSETVDLDAQADKLGIAKGGMYAMHIFFAERHMTGSDFVIETTISEFDPCR